MSTDRFNAIYVNLANLYLARISTNVTIDNILTILINLYTKSDPKTLYNINVSKLCYVGNMDMNVSHFTMLSHEINDCFRFIDEIIAQPDFDFKEVFEAMSNLSRGQSSTCEFISISLTKRLKELGDNYTKLYEHKDDN